MTNEQPVQHRILYTNLNAFFTDNLQVRELFNFGNWKLLWQKVFILKNK